MRITAIIIIISFLFSGCSQSASTELSNRLIIEAIGIDESEDGYEVSILALNTLQSGSANSTETPDGLTKVFKAKGKSIADALAQIDLISSQVPLYSQARVLIIGNEAAKNQPLETLNFFIREYTTRDDILVAVSKTTAADIISADLGKNLLISKAVKNILESGQRNALTVTVPFYKFAGDLLDSTKSACLPILKVEKNDEYKDEIKGSGLALFADKNQTATLEEDKTAGFLWAVNRIDSALLDVEYNNTDISLAVRKSKTKIRADKKNPCSFIISVTFSCDIIERNSTTQVLTSQDLTAISTLAEKQVKNKIEDFLQVSMLENHCDCVGFIKQALKNIPQDSKKNEIDRNAFLKTIKTEIRTDCKILRSGREVLQKD